MEKLIATRLTRWQTFTLICGVTFLLILAAFGRSLFQGFAPLDDDLLITMNLAIRGLTWEHLKTVFTTYDPELYIPLTFVSYQIDYMIGGPAPWIYHLTNLLLHAGNAMLVMWVMFLLTKKKWLSISAGLIFAVHPLNTEAVVWLAGRKDLLSTFFFLAAWVGYIHYRMIRGVSRNAPTATYCVSIVLFILALLSKVMAMTLPAILILTDVLIEKRKWEWRMLIDKIPYAMLSGIFLFVATAGKERIIANHSLYETALMAAKSTVFYLQKFLLPVRLGVFYPYHGEISLFLPTFLIGTLIVIALIAGAAYFFVRRQRWATFGIAFFLITLAPTFINFHKGGEMYFASDRYPYLPMVGLVFLIAMMIVIREKGAPAGRPYSHFWISCAGGGVIIALTTLSFFQTKIWDSPQALFGNTLRLYPESVAARVALASMDKQMGRYDQAIKLLRDGLAHGENLQLRMALGSVYAKIGRVDDAADQFTQALTLEPDNPEPFVALGVLDEYNKKIPEAMEKYSKAVDLDPSYVSARNKLGSLLLENGKKEAAEEQFRAALKWNPNAEGVLYNLSLILDMDGKTDEALELLERAHALNPDDVTISSALERHRHAQ
ncbi:MAG: tetratricopeptide repeat protein [Candidatus Peribacteraceae bacterium]|nr:tetratricopeptide repeat protein [Candidatus Peribacteraceae bacterium]